MTTELEKNRMLYQTLSLADYANIEEVRRAYKSLALLHHPDKNPSDPEAAAARFKDISTAYQILTVPERKASYDRRLQEATNLREELFATPLRRAATTMRRNSSNTQQRKTPTPQDRRREKEMRHKWETEKDQRIAEEAEKIKKRQMDKVREAQQREAERQREHEKLKEQLKRLQQEREKQKERNDEAMRKVMEQIQKQRSTCAAQPNSGTPSRLSTQVDDLDAEKLRRIERMEDQDRRSCLELEEEADRRCLTTALRLGLSRIRAVTGIALMEKDEEEERYEVETDMLHQTSCLCVMGQHLLHRGTVVEEWMNGTRVLLELEHLQWEECAMRMEATQNASVQIALLLKDVSLRLHSIYAEHLARKEQRWTELLSDEIRLRCAIATDQRETSQTLRSQCLAALQANLVSSESEVENRFCSQEANVRTAREEYANLFSLLVTFRVALDGAIDEQRWFRRLERQLEGLSLRHQIQSLREENESIRQQTQKAAAENKELVMMLCRENKRLLSSNARFIEENWKLNNRMRDTSSLDV